MRGSTSSYFTSHTKLSSKGDAPTCLSPSQVDDEALRIHWKTFPSPAKDFILKTLDNLSLKKLVDFWRNHSQYTSGSVAGGIYGASWYLALVYLNRNELSKARSLTLNGSFLQECYYSSFDRITNICACGEIEAQQLPYFYAGFNATRSAQGMYTFLQRSLPREYQQMLAGFVNMGTKSRVMNFVGSIDQDWQSKSLKTSLKSSTKSTHEEVHMTLVIGGDSFRVCPTMPLKTVFNDYAEKNLVSLKSLRFTYDSKILFLSTAGKKSPEELGMLDNDAIEVHSTQEAPNNDDMPSAQNCKKSTIKKQKKQPKKTKIKPQKSNSEIEVFKSDDKHKEIHSKILSKLFEEADPKFRQIRQQLNALNISKQQPKAKIPTKKLRQQCNFSSSLPNSEDLGGKAGKTHFVVNVGEVSNLYKSSKSLDRSASSTVSIIDLHGCTQEEALSMLNSRLKEWSEKAMVGTYPFIHSVSIVCGAGGQVLSETVEKWIRRQPNVSNAPKSWLAKQRYASAA